MLWEFGWRTSAANSAEASRMSSRESRSTCVAPRIARTTMHKIVVDTHLRAVDKRLVVTRLIRPAWRAHGQTLTAVGHRAACSRSTAASIRSSVAVATARTSFATHDGGTAPDGTERDGCGPRCSSTWCWHGGNGMCQCGHRGGRWRLDRAPRPAPIRPNRTRRGRAPLTPSLKSPDQTATTSNLAHRPCVRLAEPHNRGRRRTPRRDP